MKKTIGICCTGNSCRSPIMGIWLEKLIVEHGLNVGVWTAGVKVNQEHYEKRYGVEPFALIASKAMNLSDKLYEQLEAHTIKKLNDISNKTDLIFWITELHMTSKIDDDYTETRLGRMKEMAERLGSTLIIITEKDFAYEAKVKFERARDRIKDQEERRKFIQEVEPDVKAKYIEQGNIMKNWSENIYKMIK